VREVLPALEAHQIAGEQRAHEPVVLRDRGEDRGRRQRDVQEEPDRIPAAHRPQFGGERDQVVVVDPDHVAGLEQRLQAPGEQLVDPAVAGDRARLETGQVEPVVEHRPEDAVAVDAVVGIVVVAADVDRRQGHRAGLVDVQVAFAGGAAIDDAAAPAEPQAAGRVQRLAERDCQAAGGHLARIGHAVRNDDEPVHDLPASIRSRCPRAPTGGLPR